MPGKKVSFNELHKAVKVFKETELNKQSSVEEKYKIANEVLELSAAYLEDLGLDVTEPFDAQAFIQMAKSKSGRNEREEAVNAFRLSFQRVNEIHGKEKTAMKLRIEKK